jgi:hypothetical protein
MMYFPYGIAYMYILINKHYNIKQYKANLAILISCDMIWYSLNAISFPPGGSGQLTCAKIGKRQLYTKGETIHKTLQKHGIQKTNIRNKKINIKEY